MLAGEPLATAWFESCYNSTFPQGVQPALAAAVVRPWPQTCHVSVGTVREDGRDGTESLSVSDGMYIDELACLPEETATASHSQLASTATSNECGLFAR